MIEQVVIDGQWLDLVCPWGDLTYTTVWPGSSGTTSWSTHQPPRKLMRANLPVQIMAGMGAIWRGLSDEPDRDTGQMSATGLWTQANNWQALTSLGAATNVPDTAINAAIARGMPWTQQPAGFWNSAVDIDLTNGPVSITQLLQQFCDTHGLRWGIDPLYGWPSPSHDATAPTFHMSPDANMASDSTDQATILIGRYFDSATSTYKTVRVTDANAIAAGYVLEAPVNLTDRDAMSSTSATAILQTALDQGRSQPRWASSIVANFGDITNAGGVPVPLHAVAAGSVVRLHGLLDDVDVLKGNTYIDVLLGQTSVANGQLTMTPMDAPSNDLVSLLAEVPA